MHSLKGQEHYRPFSTEATALFALAAPAAGVPTEWASSHGLHSILARESGGYVGRPNYTYGQRAIDPRQWAGVHDELRRGAKSAKSSATGLGQLLLMHVERYYPSGAMGIGNAHEEAVGMLAYIKARWKDPENAWANYGLRHEGY